MFTMSKADQVRLEEKHRERQVRIAYGEWLGQFDWEHYSSLTFDSPMSPSAAQRQYLKWVKRLEKRAAGELSWFYAIERAGSGGLHIHTLTAGTRWLGTRVVCGAWYGGHAQSLVYDPTKSAAYYVTKDIGSYAVHYDIHLSERHQGTLDLARHDQC